MIEDPTIKQKKDFRLNKPFFVFGIIAAIAFITFLIFSIINITNYYGFYDVAKDSGLGGVGGFFPASKYNEVATKIGEEAGAADPALYGATLINANYTKAGDTFWFNGLGKPPVINWVFIILAIVFGVGTICLIIVSSILKKRDKSVE